MTNTAEDLNSESFTKLANDDNFNLETRIQAEGLFSISDTHGKLSAVDKGFSYAKSNNYALVLNGDFVNDYNFEGIAHKMGYKSQQTMFGEYIQDNLSQEDLQKYVFLMNYSQVGSIDPFLNQVPEFQKQAAKQQLEQLVEEVQGKDFINKLELTQKSFVEEKQDEIIQNTYGLQILYQVFMDEEAKSLANKINEYDQQVLFNPGNHENAVFVEQVRQYLDNKENIIDVANHEGYIVLEQSNGKEISMAGMTNCVHIMPYLQNLGLQEEEYNYLTSHMGIDEIKAKTIMQGNVSQEELSGLEHLIKQDKDYHRITQGQEKKLDVFLTHGQIGEVMKNNGEGMDVPYFGVAAYMSNLAEYTIEGHIHDWYDGKNSFGNNMIRAAGEFGAELRKDDNGQIITQKVQIDEDFDGNHHNDIPYGLDFLQMRVEDMMKQYGLTDLPTNDEYSSEEDQKAE